jgi:hypothetical protein
MNANDLRLYQRIDEYARDLSLEIKLVGASFELIRKKNKLSLGCFENLDDLANYIYGFQAGRDIKN